MNAAAKYPALHKKYVEFVIDSDWNAPKFEDWLADEYHDLDEAEAVASLKTSIYAAADRKNRAQ